jgi:hypothetical protein
MNDIEEQFKSNYTLGTYKLRHPFFLIFKPTLVLKRGKKSNKLRGSLYWLCFKKKLRLIKEKEAELVFETNIDIILH